MPLTRRTRQTLRRAEFGFFGVVVKHAGAHAALLRVALERRGLRLVDRLLAALADQLVNCRQDSFPFLFPRACTAQNKRLCEARGGILRGFPLCVKRHAPGRIHPLRRAAQFVHNRRKCRQGSPTHFRPTRTGTLSRRGRRGLTRFSRRGRPWSALPTGLILLAARGDRGRPLRVSLRMLLYSPKKSVLMRS